MKQRALNFALRGLIGFALMGLAACTPQTTTPPAANDVGTSSGGGGFGDENSMKLLDWSKTLTAASIRRANPKVFVGLPQGWTQERFAQLIENVKSEPRLEIARYNRELMFDYRIPKTGEPYLVATALFFRAHSAIPVNSSFSENLEPYIREIRTKLLHEAAHVMGIGLTEKTDIKARAFSVYLTGEIFAKNNFICEISDVPADYPGRAPEDSEKLSPYTAYMWVVNRPAGFAMQASRTLDAPAEWPWIRNLRAGKTTSMGNFAIAPFASGINETTLPEYSRLYTWPTSILAQPKRMTPQYFKGFEDSRTLRNWVTFIGGEDVIWTESRAGARRTCSMTERIEIPQGAAGDYKAKISFEDSCRFGQDFLAGAPPLGPLKVEFEIPCKESYNQLTNFDEFVGEKEFTTPWLIDWLSRENKLD